MSSHRTVPTQEVGMRHGNSVLRCELCRKDKKRCAFSSEAEDCDYCKKKGQRCSKKTLANEVRKEASEQTVEDNNGIPPQAFIEFLKAQKRLGGSSLHAAAVVGNLEIVQAVLQVNPGAINDEDKDGRTPLWYARKNGSVDVVEQLELAKAKVNSWVQHISDAQNHHPDAPETQALTTLLGRLQVSSEAGTTAAGPLEQVSDSSIVSDLFDWDGYYGKEKPHVTITAQPTDDGQKRTRGHSSTRKRTNSSRSQREVNRRSSRDDKRVRRGSTRRSGK
ncbi:hypothetical protein F4806DRAFT_404854 [Annulohypoxylon nitens]|nr:hypothetical protein F4806DRAFT_404854 [Annulohypoxylon nitens]